VLQNDFLFSSVEDGTSKLEHMSNWFDSCDKEDPMNCDVHVSHNNGAVDDDCNDDVDTELYPSRVQGRHTTSSGENNDITSPNATPHSVGGNGNCNRNSKDSGRGCLPTENDIHRSSSCSVPRLNVEGIMEDTDSAALHLVILILMMMMMMIVMVMMMMIMDDGDDYSGLVTDGCVD
jgi:hypothetical protein